MNNITFFIYLILRIFDQISFSFIFFSDACMFKNLKIPITNCVRKKLMKVMAN